MILAVVVILLRKFVFKKSKKNKKNTDQTERKPAVNIDITGFRVIEARKLFFVANCTARCYNTYNWVKYRLPKKEDKEDIAHGLLDGRTGTPGCHEASKGSEFCRCSTGKSGLQSVVV